MSKVGKWSTTPGSNNATPPDGWPEGQAPSSVNDCAREMMAQIRTLINDAQYIDQDFTPTYISATSFSVAGDQTSAIHAGRRLKIFDATAGAATTIYATVVTASYTTVTTVSISADAGQLTSSLSSFAIAILSRNNPSLPHGLPISTSALTTGNLTINGTTTASGAVSLLTTLSVSGAVALNSTLTVSGAVSLLTTLSVSGATVLKAALNVEGATSLSGAVACGTTLSVSGAAVIKGALSVGGAVNFAGTFSTSAISVTGNKILGSTTAPGFYFRQVTVANLATEQLLHIGGAPAGTGGIVFITNSEGRSAIYTVEGGGALTREMVDPAGVYTPGSGAAATNLYWSAGNNRYEIENRTGGSLTYYIVEFVDG